MLNDSPKLILEGPNGLSWSTPAQQAVDFMDSVDCQARFCGPTTLGNILERMRYLLTSEVVTLFGAPSVPAEFVQVWSNSRVGNVPPGYAFRIEGAETHSSTDDLIEALKAALTAEDPQHLISQVIAELSRRSAANGPAQPQAPTDGWGHTTTDASTEDLLREGAAAGEGTDRHEQVFRQLLGENNERGAIEMLIKDNAALREGLKNAQEGLEDLRQHLNCPRRATEPKTSRRIGVSVEELLQHMAAHQGHQFPRVILVGHGGRL